MELITAELREILLANGLAARNHPHFDPLPVVKWFNPFGAETWLITELHPDDEDLAYGLCDLGTGMPELGHVSVREVTSIRFTGTVIGTGGTVAIERDLHWRPDKPLSVYVRLAHAAGRIVT